MMMIVAIQVNRLNVAFFSRVTIRVFVTNSREESLRRFDGMHRRI